MGSPRDDEGPEPDSAPPRAEAMPASGSPRPQTAPGGTGDAGVRMTAVWATGLAAVMVLAIALRLYRLTAWPFEQDELYTLRDSPNALRGVLTGLNAKPVFYLLNQLVLEVLPASPLTLRAFPLAFGIAGVWVTWRLASDRFGQSAGWVAALMVAVSPWHLYASQFARYWSLVYLLAASVYVLYPRSVHVDRVARYLVVLVVVLLGALTHPTFLFPMVGAFVGFHLLSDEGQVRWSWPTRRAWLGLWAPAILLLCAGYVALRLSGNEDSLRNWSGRGLAANLRLVPAVVQWTGPAVVAAACAGIAYLCLGTSGRDRRWASLAGLGLVSTVALVLAASFETNVYADYAMGMLPLLYVTIGGAVQRLADGRPHAHFVVGAAAFVLCAAVLPSTVSHMSDGTRFDYRPAFEHIRDRGPSELMMGWPKAARDHYARELRYSELRPDSASYARILEQNGGFWLVTSHRRYGMMFGTRQVLGWMRAHCRTEAVFQRPRLDYRTYRVELAWCGERQPGGRSTEAPSPGPAENAEPFQSAVNSGTPDSPSSSVADPAPAGPAKRSRR